jgi:hypothetical protein
MKTILTLLLLMGISQYLFAQCDPALFDKLNTPAQGMKLLTRYSIQVKKIEDVPYGAQYSYVFSKGAVISFLIEYSPDSKDQLNFTLSDDKGNVLKKMKKQNIGTAQQLTFEVTKTGIYFFTVHAKQSFDGCAVLQLSSRFEVK